MWELDFWSSALGAGGVIAIILFAEHYALDHWRATFLKHPPRAYSIGVLTLFAGYAVWAAAHPAPVPPLWTVGALFVLTVGAGSGTWGAWTWHAWQRRRARRTTQAAL